MSIPVGDPVDGYTVSTEAEVIVLILSDRYGRTDRYRFTAADAASLGEALLDHALDIILGRLGT